MKKCASVIKPGPLVFKTSTFMHGAMGIYFVRQTLDMKMRRARSNHLQYCLLEILITLFILSCMFSPILWENVLQKLHHINFSLTPQPWSPCFTHSIRLVYSSAGKIPAPQPAVGHNTPPFLRRHSSAANCLYLWYYQNRKENKV